MKKVFLFLGALILSTAMWATDYYIAGNGSVDNNWCCGKNWQADGCAMSEGAYSAKVPAGTYEFKVTNGTWSTSWGFKAVDASKSTSGYEGSDNVKFTVAAEANINVTFNGTNIILTSDVPFGSVIISSWTVAGEESLMGSDWNPADTNNDMELVGGAYSLVKDSVNLAAGDYDYKFVANHAWSIKELPTDGNKTLTIAAAGMYTVTFTLNATGTEGSATAELIPGPQPEAKYFAKNNWNGGDWAWLEMAKAEEVYKLDSVVFGGTGVNINTKEDDKDALWITVDKIAGDSIAAKDTVTLVFNPADSSLTASLIGRPAPGPQPAVQYFAKNNWNGGTDWTWLEMKNGENNYAVLDSVVFGGTGVNINTKEDEKDALWFPLADIQILGEDSIQALDTISLIFDPANTTLAAQLIGRPAAPETKYFAKNNWDGGDWAWLEMTKSEDEYILEEVVYGGTGININTKTDDADALWFDETKMQYYEGDSIKANDTVSIIFNPADSTLTAVLIARPAPVAKAYYITGDSALVGEFAWKADALKMDNDSNHTFLAMAAGDYKLKVTDGTWANNWGFANLSEASSEGLSGDADGNICFTVEVPNNVYVAIANGVVTVTGDFKKPQPVIYDTLTLYADSVWASDGAKIAAWVWGEGVTDQWTAFFAGEELVLTAAFPENATGIKFVRFADYVQSPDWNAGEGIWGQTGDETIDNCLTYYANGYASQGVLAGQWCNQPTALDNLNDNRNDNGKFILNGQLYIIRNGMTFDAQGKIVK